MVSSANWDGVPWAVGGGAVHSTNVARLLAFAAFRGREGIIAATDLEVRALAAPGPQIRVYPGACSILNRAANIQSEAYVARLPVEETIDVSPTGGTIRSDLVVARVENPHIVSEPWDEPADPAVGPYMFTRIITGVPSTTESATELGLSDSMIPLARIDLPASTSTVQQSHIVDLRFMADTLRERETLLFQPTQDKEYMSTNFEKFPIGMNLETRVPEWATHVSLKGDVAGVFSQGNVQGQVRVDFGGQKTQATQYNTPAGTNVIQNIISGGGTIAIPESLRGEVVAPYMELSRALGDSGVGLEITTFSTHWLDIEYKTAPIPNV